MVRSIEATYIDVIKLRPPVVMSSSLNSFCVNALQFLCLFTFSLLLVIFDFARSFLLFLYCSY